VFTWGGVTTAAIVCTYVWLLIFSGQDLTEPKRKKEERKNRGKIGRRLSMDGMKINTFEVYSLKTMLLRLGNAEIGSNCSIGLSLRFICVAMPHSQRCWTQQNNYNPKGWIRLITTRCPYQNRWFKG